MYNKFVLFQVSHVFFVYVMGKYLVLFQIEFGVSVQHLQENVIRIATKKSLNNLYFTGTNFSFIITF